MPHIPRIVTRSNNSDFVTRFAKICVVYEHSGSYKYFYFFPKTDILKMVELLKVIEKCCLRCYLYGAERLMFYQ